MLKASCMYKVELKAGIFSTCEEEVQTQLSKMKEGEFTEEEILSVKKSMRNSYTSLSDSLSALEGWYFSQSLQGSYLTPEEALAEWKKLQKRKL